MTEVETLAKAMRFAEASAAALREGDVVRAFELAIEARDATALENVASALGSIAEADRRSTCDRARAAAMRRHDKLAEGLAAEAAGDVDDAMALYEAAEAWGRAAKLHLARGEIAKAGRALEHQVRRDPADVPSRKSLARILLDIGRTDAALRTLSGLADDDEVRALRDRGHGALGLGDAVAAETKPVAEGEAKLLFGRYEVVREVASTPSSRVLEARDRLDPARARVALKIFTGTGHIGAGRDALARFRREVEVLAKIDAKPVLKPKALLDEGPTVVLPWLSGGNLDELLARGRPTAKRAAEIATRMLDALDAAHRRGIVHRDVKPANVLLDEAGGAYLADFGVAHLGDASATATAGVIGTLRYMAPEQRLGEPATPRSDLYAVGVILSELLGVSAEEAPPAIASLLGEMLAPDPAERIESAEAARARISAISWPDEPFATHVSIPPSLRPSAPPAAERFTAEGPRRRDLLLQRDELLIAEDDPRLPLALALAELTHPALPRVFGVERNALRVEVIEGSPEVALDDEGRGLVREALTALHRLGVAHGAVRACLRKTRRGFALAFPEARPDPSVESDLAALG
ncbi:MAG: protein kinase domain-containing protein [Polyangiales bacterium]